MIGDALPRRQARRRAPLRIALRGPGRGGLERVDEHQELCGRPVVQLCSVGQASIAVAGGDGAEGHDERPEVIGDRRTRQLAIQFGHDGRHVAGEQRCRHGEGEATIGIVVFPAIAPVCQIALAGSGFRLRGEIGAARTGLDLGEDGPRLPWFGRMAE